MIVTSKEFIKLIQRYDHVEFELCFTEPPKRFDLPDLRTGLNYPPMPMPIMTYEEPIKTKMEITLIKKD